MTAKLANTNFNSLHPTNIRITLCDSIICDIVKKNYYFHANSKLSILYEYRTATKCKLLLLWL